MTRFPMTASAVAGCYTGSRMRGCFSILFLTQSPCLHGKDCTVPIVRRLERGESGVTVEALAAQPCVGRWVGVQRLGLTHGSEILVQPVKRLGNQLRPRNEVPTVVHNPLLSVDRRAE